jgi:hypothetical protein
MALLLSESDVRAVLTMPDAVACIEAATKAHGLQDVAMAGHVYQKAIDAGLGQQAPPSSPERNCDTAKDHESAGTNPGPPPRPSSQTNISRGFAPLDTPPGAC